MHFIRVCHALVRIDFYGHQMRGETICYSRCSSELVGRTTIKFLELHAILTAHVNDYDRFITIYRDECHAIQVFRYCLLNHLIQHTIYGA